MTDRITDPAAGAPADRTDTAPTTSFLTPTISSPAMRAIVGDCARIQRMLDFLGALARAEAAVGVIPATASEAIAQAADASRFDIPALGATAVATGSLAAALIAALKAQVTVVDAAIIDAAKVAAAKMDATRVLAEAAAVAETTAPTIQASDDGTEEGSDEAGAGPTDATEAGSLITDIDTTVIADAIPTAAMAADNTATDVVTGPVITADVITDDAATDDAATDDAAADGASTAALAEEAPPAISETESTTAEAAAAEITIVEVVEVIETAVTEPVAAEMVVVAVSAPAELIEMAGADLAPTDAPEADAGIVAVPAGVASVADQAAAAPEPVAIPSSARYVGFGAVEQDICDTAQMLELRAGIDALLADLNRAIEAFIALAGKHRRTASIARTALRHAVPIPFGLKLAGYASALARSRDRLRRLRREALVLQFGGDAGTLAALGENGLKVTDKLAALLDLPAPEAPWHGHSDRLAEVASALAILAGSCGKIARDIALLMQSEVAEAFETASHAGDNPRLARRHSPHAVSIALAAATAAPNLLATIIAGQVQEHERALGGWHAQAQAFPTLLMTTAGAVEAVAGLAQGLGVDAERMRSNLELSHGLVMTDAIEAALGAKLPADEATAIVEDASRKAMAEKHHLSIVLGDDARVAAALTPGELARVFESMNHQGVSQNFIERIVAASAARSAKRV